LANGLVNAEALAVENEPRYPLAVALCPKCRLSQLTVVVDPKILYTHYRFSSGMSRAWLVHCRQLANSVIGEKGAKGFVVDIAANDGSQLHQFKSADWKLLGVEPSDVPTLLVGAHPHEVRANIPIIREFWSQEVANQIKREHGLVDVVIAQNVFGHVPDPVGFLKAAKSVLAADGQVIVEVPDVGDMIDNLAFDTIYHEHLSYWSGLALERAAEASGLRIRKLEAFPEIHGGSVRYWLEHFDGATQRDSSQPDSVAVYTSFAQRVSQTIDLTASIISGIERGRFLAWGASAKGAVMMNAIYNRWPRVSFPIAVIDQTPEKQGFLTPGVHIPVIPPPDDLSNAEVIWVLSWNWLPQIRAQADQRGFAGKYLVTSPSPRLV
jgi:SAM-dependent methyltransferase